MIAVTVARVPKHPSNLAGSHQCMVDGACRFCLAKKMLSPQECRDLAAEYESRANADGTTKRLAHVLMGVSRLYTGLATQLDLVEQVQKEEETRLSIQRDRSLISAPCFQSKQSDPD